MNDSLTNKEKIKSLKDSNKIDDVKELELTMLDHLIVTLAKLRSRL